MADLDAKKREQLPAKDFGLPEKARTKAAKKESGNYPMPDKAHARNAKSRAAQARKAGHGLGDELALLTVHGVLHLLGYDHGEPEQEREMFGLQNALLAEWQSARHEAAAREAQRRHDSRLLGTVGLEDS